MIRRQVVYAPAARSDLLRLLNWLAEVASPELAIGYVEQIEDFADRLAFASERGTRREDIRPGLRIVSYRRRVLLAFEVAEYTVTVLRIFYGGQNWEGAWDDESAPDTD